MEDELGSNQYHLACVGDESSPTPQNVARWLESQPLQDFSITADFGLGIDAALGRLEDGDVDLIAVSASTWSQVKDVSRFTVAAALPRREENHILVANDRIHKLEHKSVILCQNKLQRRQLRRYRPDFRILKPSAFADLISRNAPENWGLELQEWMEDLRSTKIITGYVTERHLFTLGNIDARRHTLMTDSKEGSSRFIPSPFQGLTLLISRPGFPPSIATQIGDEESMTAWVCEDIIKKGLDCDLHDRVGVLVRYRQIPSLLNQADAEKDLLRSTSLLDTEGEIISEKSMVEMLIEVIDRKGGRTLLLERLSKKEDATINARIIVSDWNEMYQTVTDENEDDPRLGPARPPFFVE
ncbi:MAG: hypothetical protein CMB37_06760 [Euryarchaeota archaeon]|nr:hypothetical protein [Euryarchaeota archaeon]